MKPKPKKKKQRSFQTHMKLTKKPNLINISAQI
jgi:hypothetical protein